MNEPKATVFVVDDDESTREALESLIRSAGWRVEAFGSAVEFLTFKRPEVPSCLVLDIRMPKISGLELQQRLLNLQPKVPIIFVTGYGDIPTTVQAMKAGAVEFLVKPYLEDNLLESIRQAITRDQVNRRDRALQKELLDRLESLTPRERQVMEHVVSGLLNKQIAGELGTSEITIKVHRSQVMQKMKAGSLAELVKMSERLNSLLKKH